ncbi:MAG: hypothetical protein M3328_07570, partial [Chloroflexota bacterium]|nr:hypothetical protein [Chloroflexota bacterium]
MTLLLATAALWPAWRQFAGPTGSPSPMQAALPDIAAVPLSFEPNVGQTDTSVSFLAHAPGGTLFFT